MIDLNQDELKVIVGILTQVQLVYKDSIVVNQIIQKLDSHIVKPKPEVVPIVPQDHKEGKV
jgi:hypothetical protein